MILPENCTIEKYGLYARFVEERDADFIFMLRSDKTLNRYIHDIKGGVEEQRVWIKKYKERQKEGKEYYFIFYKNDEAVGVFRLYAIHGKTYTGGSWVMKKKSSIEEVVGVSIIARGIAFDILGMELEDDYDACHVDNKKVIKFNFQLGMKIYKHFQDVKGEYVAMSLTKTDFNMNKSKLLKAIGY